MFEGKPVTVLRRYLFLLLLIKGKAIYEKRHDLIVVFIWVLEKSTIYKAFR